MKTPEDEAFDELARKQGAWGGGFKAKRQMAMDKINADFDEEYKKMHEDRINYGTAWSQDGKRIDPTSVYKEPVTEREALKLALEALESDYTFEWPAMHRPKKAEKKRFEAITAIKAALAQPAQEPVAFDAFLESEDFYELMQAYRHFPIDALVQFEAVKDALRTAHNVKKRNFCPRCGKRTNDIHTCTPPQGAA